MKALALRGIIMSQNGFELTTTSKEELVTLFGENIDAPSIMMFDDKKVLTPSEVINLSSGENMSLSEIINTPVVLQGMGGVRLQYVDENTGEVLNYIRYLLITDKGNYTTTSSFIGRTLKMLYQISPKSPTVMFKQKEKDGRRKFFMEIM